MKYEEFKEKIKELDSNLIISDEPEQIIIYLKEGCRLISISKEYKDSMDDSWMSLTDYKNRRDLLFLGWELKSTPIETREKEKKYYYYLPHLEKGYYFLNLVKSRGVIEYSTKTESYGFRTQFTEKEFEEMSKRFNIPESIHEKEEA